jgi:predicted Zn-dependent protease
MNTSPVTDEITITRRDFLWFASISTAGFVLGCATNPVTGQSQLMLMSEQQEVQIDKQHSPHQFSNDYGELQDKELNRYIQEIGNNMAAKTHRPNVPYSFRGVNATYVNAYAFPGGSIAATRGILLNIENEAELAGLLGHELGHVNARHSAERMSKGMLSQAVIGGLTVYAGTRGQAFGQIASVVGMVGASALLAKYSRNNEREADALGMEYMVRSGYHPNGLVDLMDMLKSMSKHQPSMIEAMFSSHPMSDERYDTAVERSETEYRSAWKLPKNKERYMDKTAKLRAMKGAIEEMQKGESKMAQKKYPDAEQHFKKALKQAPNDYAGLVMMSKCQMALNRPDEAKRYAERAKSVYPKEAQAHQMSGFAKLQKKNFNAAYNDFNRYEQLLPGNPNTVFYKGYTLEKMGRKKASASEYYRYLQTVQQGDEATYAHQRLIQWGVVKP